MAKCYISGKKTGFKTNISHSHRKTKKLVKPNLHKIHIVENGVHKHVLVSARALKSAKLNRI